MVCLELPYVFLNKLLEEKHLILNCFTIFKHFSENLLPLTKCERDERGERERQQRQRERKGEEREREDLFSLLPFFSLRSFGKYGFSIIVGK